MAKDKNDYSGETYGRLTLLRKNGDKQEYFCSCECGRYTEDNPKLISYSNIKHKNTKSCGCLQRETVSKIMKNKRKKDNIYDLSGEYGVCYDSSKENCWLFDLEDYEIIKPYYWNNKDGYASAKDTDNNTTILMSRLIMGLKTKDKKYVDHINHDTYDNRKYNLRVCTNSQNNMNRGLQSNNKSGITGVCWNKNKNKWEAQIYLNGKHIHLGLYIKKEDAIDARKKAEKEYFGEYRYNNSIIKENNNEHIS